MNEKDINNNEKVRNNSGIELITNNNDDLYEENEEFI